jgi:hypothetical protein
MDVETETPPRGGDNPVRKSDPDFLYYSGPDTSTHHAYQRLSGADLRSSRGPQAPHYF